MGNDEVGPWVGGNDGGVAWRKMPGSLPEQRMVTTLVPGLVRKPAKAREKKSGSMLEQRLATKMVKGR